MQQPPNRLSWQQLTLQLRNPFRLSYGVSDTRQVYWIRLEGDEGWGEAAIPPYYGVNPQDMIAVWQRAALSEKAFPDDPARVAEWVGTNGPAPARCALEMALFDRIARQQNLPLYRLLQLPQPRPISTSFTIAIDTPDAMAEMARGIAGYPIIKVKLGSEDDESRLAAIRAARPDVKLRVDANAGWTEAQSRVLIERLCRYDLEMIEQPLPREQIEAMGALQKDCPVPITADESVQSMNDVERLAAAGVQAINVKLMKVGGISAALAIFERAQALGLRIMLGQMIETSIGATAMAHFTGLAEWVDLDSPMLVSNDPFEGIFYHQNAAIQLPRRAGIGVRQIGNLEE
jgi:L-alanine-DL-glutamate epimerase-like enolase superfamily enzyme